MSGGYFEYADRRAKDEIFGYSGDKPKGNVFEDREITELVWDVFNLIHDFDWYQSGDTCKETYLLKKGMSIIFEKRYCNLKKIWYNMLWLFKNRGRGKA